MDQDDTQSNKPYDAAAAAKRKRRSSILKSQRPPRTPFSDLEFNVATPTETTKSRRVSFSKRTGVAEFVTNEGTTTWENFYEKHNKSLETSGNDPPNPQRPVSIGQLGRSIFDQQFEEVEAIDFGGTILPTQTLAQQLQNSLNNGNITQQLAALECSRENLNPLPQQYFELSEITDQRSKVFNDELTIPAVAEMSNQMNVDFSAIQSKCDDLDEIQMDLNRHHPKFVGPVHFGNVSEYIEVDLNMTSVGLRNDDDMSITETVHSPKVQEVAKAVSKKINTDYNVEDKENIALNPYAAICESANFAMEEKNEVLVFDGKKLTVQIEKKRVSVEPRPRKTIILNINDDLPNFISEPKPCLKLQETAQENRSLEPAVSGKAIEKRRTIIYNDDCNMSTTQAIPSNIIQQHEAPVNPERKSRTIIYNDDFNMSTTQAIPSNIIHQLEEPANPERRKTIIYNDDCNMSTTQAIPSHIIQQYNAPVNPERRRTIIYNDDCNMSTTQAIPSNIIQQHEEPVNPERRRTIIYKDDCNMSTTQAIPSNIIQRHEEPVNPERRRTIIYNDDCNMSTTQAIPSNIIQQHEEPVNPERRRTIIYKDDCNMSTTQAIPSNIIQQHEEPVNPERRRTIIYNDDCNMSTTQAIPSNIIQKQEEPVNPERRRTIIYNDDCNMSTTQAIPSNIIQKQEEPVNPERRRTIIYNDDCNMSTTQAKPSNIIQKQEEPVNPEKRRTILYDRDCDISMTKALQNNVIIEAFNAQVKEKTMSTTQVFPTMEVRHKANVAEAKTEKRRTILFENDGDLSITQAIPTDIIQQVDKTERRQTVLFGNDGDVSLTRSLPTNIVNTLNQQSLAKSMSENKNETNRRTYVYEDDCDVSMTQAVPATIYQREDITSGPSTQDINTHNKTESCEDISHTQVLTQNRILPSMTTICDKDDVSITQEKSSENKTEDGYEMDISMSRADPQSGFISRIEKQIPFAPEDEKNQTKPLQILPIIESALVKECQPTNLKGNKAKAKVHISNTESEKTFPINLENIQNTKTSNATQPTDLNISVDDVKVEEQLLQNEFKLINETDKSNYVLLNKQSNDLTLEEGIQTGQTKTNDCESNSDQVSSYQFANVSPNTKKPSKVSANEDSPMDVCLDVTESIDKENQIEGVKSNFEEPPISVTGSVVSQISTKTKKSILNELLDMSTCSEEYLDDKCIMAVKSDDIQDNEDGGNAAEIKSSDVFKITRSFDEPDLEEFKSKTEIENAVENEDVNDVNDLMYKLQKLKTAPSNVRYEQVVSDDMEDLNKTDARRSFKNADNTRELLQMLSEFTDRPSHPPTIDEEDMYLNDEEKYGQTQTEPRRISFATNRRSIVLSKEELFNNISMAQAALQESHYVDESFDDATETSNDTIDIEDRHTKSLRISGDVVKALKFDDDEDIVTTPLKKTAFGETTYMNENKSKVIPTYDIKDGIKELMSDLVKPMVEIPFDDGHLDGNRESPSTISTQVQANLVTSSQIDIDVELHSPESDESTLLNKVTALGSKALASVFPAPKVDDKLEKPKSPRSRSSVPGHVLVFDPSNPLNNVQLSSRDYENVHPYNPLRCERAECSQNTETIEDGRVEAQYNVIAIASGDAGTKINTSVKSKPLQQTVIKREIEINTEIAMKQNSELLNDHSSLTLVDGALGRDTFDVDLGSQQSELKLPVRVIYEMDENGCLSEKFDVTSNEEIVNEHRKRSLSPRIPNMDVTPKPQSKMQKISKSPQQRNPPKTSITVQEIMTEFNITRTEQSEIAKRVNEAVDFEMGSVTSYASSGRSEGEFASVTSRVDFSVSEQSSKNVLVNCESSTNVVAKIDMLPFMGRDCEWESTSGDTWSFLLLRSRIRLIVKREHSYYNASRTCVRADTPILTVNAECTPNDDKDTLIALCLRLATDSMRYECSRNCCTAGDVPALLKRCVRVSKHAVQWLRAMKDAMLRLAFHVDRDGRLTVKVANIRLRSVWEVTMRIELTVEDGHESAWPLATCVGIETIVSDVDVSPDSLARLIQNVPHDWGHVPRTIWKLFKYLKNKSRCDDFFGMSILNMVK